MKKVIKYETNDGQLFDTEQEAIDHEYIASGIYIREYLWRDHKGLLHIAVIENTINFCKPKDIEQRFDFVRWVDEDWREVKA